MPPGADAVAQARALLAQLRSLASQHGEVLSAYERQLEAMVAAGPSKLTKAPNKRPLLSEPEGPEAKKQRIVQEQQQRRNALWHECYKVLDRCRRNQRAEAFKKPVDPIRMKIPDYPLVIKNPMDLQTVGEKLKVRAYKDPSEFATDMRLIWDNAQLYNGRNHPVGINAMAMSEFFEKAWAPLQIEKQWAIQLQQEELAQQALQGNLDSMPSSDLPRQLKEKREMVGHYIAAKDYTDGMPPGALGPCEPGRPMTFEEKRRLSAFLTNIPLAASEPGEKLQRVVEIVEEGLPPGDGAEVEVDIDALPDAVLWRLKEHVDSVLAPPGGTTPAKGGAATKGGGGGTPGGPASKSVPQAAAAAPGAAAPVAAAAPPQAAPTKAPAAVGATPPVGTPPPPMPTASQLAMPAPPALGAPQQPPQQPAPQQQQQPPGSPPLSGADSAHDVQDSNAPGRPLTSAAPYIPGDGTVAQSGIHRPSSTFVKAGKAEVDTRGLNAAAWGAAPTTAPDAAAPAPAPAAPGANGTAPSGTPPPPAGAAPAAAPDTAAAAVPAADGAAAVADAAAAPVAAAAEEDDDLWDEFAGKAAKQEKELEQKMAEEQRRKQQEEEQRRALEEADRAREAERAAAVEAEKARARDELMGLAGRAQLGEDGALASEVQRLAAAGGGDAAAGLGLAAPRGEEEEDEDMGLDG